MTEITEWILCPVCESKTRLKIRKDTILQNFPLYCPKCKQETLIRIEQLNITTSYLRSENFILAVEENVSYLNPPVSEVFRTFLAQSNLISGNPQLALENIKYKISNEVYQEWIDAVIACQEDKTLKTTLTPIISKLSDMRIVSAELDMLLYEPMKEFITMALLLVCNIPLIYFLNKSWFDTLTTTIVGKGVLALSAAAIAMLASSSAVGFGMTAQSAKTSTPSSPMSLSGHSMRKQLETVFMPGFALMIWSAGRSISPVE